jgi:hypothetical protein
MKVETDIITSIATNSIRRAVILVIIYVIVFIGNVMCLMSHDRLFSVSESAG